VPLAFPSHQGLIAPLWRRWPNRFDALALCVGAAAPDIVDGSRALVRGHLGQGIGHSLIGLVLLCLPSGIALTLILRPIVSRMSWLREIATRGPMASIATSVLAGAFSHLAFDFVSHDKFLWLLPWYENPNFFPAFWYARWAEIHTPFYDKPYPIGPHFVVWLTLSVVGAVMFFRRPR
jgi:hypothetical protein